MVFFLIKPRWFFIHGGKWRKLPRKVSYKRTFGAPDQGQMLDVWGSQTAESALTWQTCYVAPRHILELTLEAILDHKIGIKDHDLVFSPGSLSESLSLPRNQYRREQYVLGIVQGQIMIVLELSRDKIMTNSTPCGPSFLDPTLSLIISDFHFWYHNHYFFNYLVILVTSTQHVLRSSRVSLRLAKRPSAGHYDDFDSIHYDVHSRQK